MSTPRVEEVLSEAIARPSPERERYIREACGGDDELRAEVESLLAAHASAGEFMGDPSVELEAAPAPVGEGEGAVIGRYRLLQQVGEGGFGAVFMAEQREPVRRRVAVKIIKLGMDTRQVIARFEAERQALAMMDHPGIARVLDAGATKSGRPYFVMELVRGEPITAYCDREKLSIRRRLELFREVCAAVQHAHQKGIIHRDLKPSNILVSEIDGRPAPKIIDFGIAKATGGHARLTDKTLFTDFRQFIGTPEYMSPEQAGMGVVDIDTRSDIYSLGVLLYELLTGAPPFDPDRLRSAEWDEMRRIIREDTPQRPSTRLHSRGDAWEVADLRRTEPERLVGLVRGDLDWIVMKCLDKDRARRYDTANGLTLDIGRHLAGRPVLAAPPSRAYRARKFVARHRGAAGAGLAIGLALVFGVIGTSAGLARAIAAERQTHRQAAELARVVEFQQSRLAGVDAELMGQLLRRDILNRARTALSIGESGTGTPGSDPAVLERALDAMNFTDVAKQSLNANIFQGALSAVDEQFADQPRLRARLLQTLANTMRELGLLDRAAEVQSEALEIRRGLLGNDDPDTLESIHETGLLLRARGEFTAAEAYIREALAGRRRVLGDLNLDTLSSVCAMRSMVRDPARMDEAEAYYREAADGYRRALGPDDPQTLSAERYLVSLLGSQGKLAEAEAHQRRLIEGYRRTYDPDHPHMLHVMAGMVRVLEGQGKPAEAYVREVLRTFEGLKPDGERETIMGINAVVDLLTRTGRLAEAEPHYRARLEYCRATLGVDHPETLLWLNQLGGVLMRVGRPTDAEPYFREALEGRRRVLGADHPHTLGTTMDLGASLCEQHRWAEAEPYLMAALEGCGRVMGDNSPRTLEWMSDIGGLLRTLGRLDEADQFGAEAVRRARSVLPGSIQTADILANHARTLAAMDRFPEAEAQMLEARGMLSAVYGPAHPRTTAMDAELARLYDAWHAPQPDAGPGG